MKSEWADCAAVQAECGNPLGNELTRNSSGNTLLQSSQLAEPLWTDPGLKSGISLRELISTSKKKNAGGEWIVEHSPKFLAREEKKKKKEATIVIFLPVRQKQWRSLFNEIWMNGLWKPSSRSV